MKKIILGIFLLVGISETAFARNASNEKEFLLKTSEQKKEIVCHIQNINFDKVFDCWHSYFLKTVDCDGRIMTTNAGGNAGSCVGNEDGTVIMHMKTQKVCTPEAQASLVLQQLSDALNF